MAEALLRVDYLRKTPGEPIRGNLPRLINTMNRLGNGQVVDIVRYNELLKSKPESDLNPRGKLIGMGPLVIVPGEGASIGSFIEYKYAGITIRIGGDILGGYSKEIRGYATNYVQDEKSGIIQKGMLAIPIGFKRSRGGEGIYPDPVVGFIEGPKNTYVMRIAMGGVWRAQYDPEKRDYVVRGVQLNNEVVHLPAPWIPPSHDRTMPYVGLYLAGDRRQYGMRNIYALVETGREEAGGKK